MKLRLTNAFTYFAILSQLIALLVNRICFSGFFYNAWYCRYVYSSHGRNQSIVHTQYVTLWLPEQSIEIFSMQKHSIKQTSSVNALTEILLCCRWCVGCHNSKAVAVKLELNSTLFIQQQPLIFSRFLFSVRSGSGTLTTPWQ